MAHHKRGRRFGFMSGELTSTEAGGNRPAHLGLPAIDAGKELFRAWNALPFFVPPGPPLDLGYFWHPTPMYKHEEFSFVYPSLRS